MLSINIQASQSSSVGWIFTTFTNFKLARVQLALSQPHSLFFFWPSAPEPFRLCMNTTNNDHDQGRYKKKRFFFGCHPLLKTTLTGLRRTYLRFLVFRPKLTKTKRFPPFLDHMNGKLFLGGSRFWSGKIGPKLAVGGHRSQCPAELSFIFNRCPAGNPLFLTDKIYF